MVLILCKAIIIKEQFQNSFTFFRFIRKEKLLADRLTLVKQPTFHDHSTVPREKPLTKKQVKKSSNDEALALKTLHMAELRGKKSLSLPIFSNCVSVWCVCVCVSVCPDIFPEN